MQNPTKFAAIVAGVVGAITTGALAQGLRAVEPLRGYSCMSLNLTEEEMQHADSSPVIRQEPSASAVQIGRASAQVIVANPVTARNGYFAVLTLDGKPGWVEAGNLKPYHSVSNPTARCVASVMSNGQPGFTFQH